MFGKRNRTAEPAQPRQDSPTPGGRGPSGSPSGEARLPWSEDPSSAACNLAAGNLANNLGTWVAHEGRLHAETYVAVSGAIAGYAAQRTLMAAHTFSLPPDMQMVTTASGDRYLFGDSLNDMLFAKTEADAGGRVWPRAVSAAVGAGLPLSSTPGLDDMFGHVTGSLGGPMEGRPSTGQDHQPIVPVRELLALHWPHVARLFQADFDDTHRRFGPVPLKWWCAVAAHVTARPVVEVSNVLDPAIALTILMESAIYASKLTSF